MPKDLSISFDELKIFLEKKVFKTSIKILKPFSKGSFLNCYVKLKNNTELTVKFYRTAEIAIRSYQIAVLLEQDPKLKVPRLFHIKSKYFKYQDYYGLCFYYITGYEISANKLTEDHFKEVIDNYYRFSKINTKNCSLGKELPLYDHIQNYFKFAEKQYSIYKNLKKNVFQKFLLKMALRSANKFALKIAKDHEKGKVYPQYLVHSDLGKSNIIFENNHFKAFLDTDAARLGYANKDLAQFIFTTVQHFPLFKSKRKAIVLWYKLVDQKYRLSYNEYKYGIDMFFIINLYSRLNSNQKKINLWKFFSFLGCLKLRDIFLKSLLNLK